MILLAVEYNKRVKVYVNGKKAFEKEGELHQYTDSTVAIKTGDTIVVYDENGTKLTKYPWELEDMSNVTGLVL